MGKSVGRALQIFLSLAFLFWRTGTHAQVVPGQCGFDRWPVKILADQDRSRVDFKPIDSTVTKLGAIPIHEVPYPYNKRIEPEELHLYRMRARLLRVRHEEDSDLHLLVADPDDNHSRMIAEIPSPACANGSGHEEEYRKARAEITLVPLGRVIEIVGVGFFDFLHEQKGAARNGIELHPVLSVRLIEDTPK